MYIPPNSKIYILHNVPLDNTYNHTISWENATTQESYFTSLAKYKLTEQTYQRVQKGSARVQVKAEDLYDCNYLMFQNTSFGNKWFYAFITGVEYINNITSEISFVIDVMQTWYFDFTLKDCFIERQHADYDAIGANTVPENLEQGPYYVSDEDSVILPNGVTTRMVLVTTFDQSDPSFPAFPGRITNRMYCGLYYGFFSDPAELNLMLEAIVTDDKQGGIVDLFMSPIDEGALGYDTFLSTYEISKARGGFGSYTPKNNKLYTYPYNVLHLYTSDSSCDYRYEWFNTDTCKFAIIETIVPEVSISMMPVNYNGMPPNRFDYERKITSANYPQCAYKTNVYDAYLAANASSLPLRMISLEASKAFTAINVGANLGTALATNNPVSIANSVIGGAQNLFNADMAVKQELARLSDISTLPEELHGNQTNSSDYAIGAKQIKYKKLKIRSEYARIIDEYFTMFGYAIHRVATPNIDSRQYFNYIKTGGCVITGSVPADDMATICKIHDNGITYWHDPSVIGDYSVNNRITEVG